MKLSSKFSRPYPKALRVVWGGRCAAGDAARGGAHLRHESARGPRALPHRRPAAAAQQPERARAPPPSDRPEELALRRHRRGRHGEHDLRVAAGELRAAPPRAVGLPARSLLSLAGLAPAARPGARAGPLGTDLRAGGHSAAARRQPLPARAPRPRSPSRRRLVAHSPRVVSDAVHRTDTHDGRPPRKPWAEEARQERTPTSQTRTGSPTWFEEQAPQHSVAGATASAAIRNAWRGP